MSEVVRQKRERAISRLLRGQLIYRLPSGQWKFGGNKFLPDRVAAALPVERAFDCNNGKVAFRLSHDYRAA